MDRMKCAYCANCYGGDANGNPLCKYRELPYRDGKYDSEQMRSNGCECANLEEYDNEEEYGNGNNACKTEV